MSFPAFPSSLSLGLANNSQALKFLESMGLPKMRLSATRQEVESGKLAFRDMEEYQMYSRYDAPSDRLMSDVREDGAEAAAAAAAK